MTKIIESNERVESKATDVKGPAHGEKDVKREPETQARVNSDEKLMSLEKPISERSAKVGPAKVSEEAERLLKEADNYLFGAGGFEVDKKKAMELYAKAANAGHAVAAFVLAEEYTLGRNLEKNDIKAFEFCKIAADLGHTQSAIMLGGFYKDGIGVRPDYNMARVYYNKAVAAGGSVDQILFDELDCEGLTNYQKGERFEKLAEEKLKVDSHDIELYLKTARDFYKAAVDVAGAKEKAADMDFKLGELFEKKIPENYKSASMNPFAVISLNHIQEAFQGGSPLAKAKLERIIRLLEGRYVSGDRVSEQVDDQHLALYIQKQSWTIDDAIVLIYGNNAGPYFEDKGKFLRAAQCYFIASDLENYHRMIAQAQLERKDLTQQKEPSVEKMRAKREKLSESINQGMMSEYFWNFLDMLAIRSPKSYSKDENYRIYEDMKEGNCHGYTHYYAMLALSTDKGKLQDRSEKYAAFMNRIVSWSKPFFLPPQGFSYNKFRAGDKQGLTEDEIERLEFTNEIENFIQMIRFAQKGVYEEKNDWVPIGERFKVDYRDVKMIMGDEFESKVDIFQYSVNVKQSLYDLSHLINVSLTESSAVLLSYPLSLSSGHIISITYREGKYFYFDSNHSGTEMNYDLSYSAIACDSVDEVIGMIIKIYNIDDDLKGKIDLRVIERTDLKE